MVQPKSSWSKQFEYGKAWWPAQYCFNFFLCMSQLGSTILGGDPDESISSRTGKGMLKKHPVAMVLGTIINTILWDKNHCVNSIERDEGRKQIWRWY